MNKKATYEKEILKVIKENNLFSIVDIFAFYTGCSRATFYNQKLDKLDTIKRAIDNNKTKTKQSLKNKWYKSDNPTLQIALYKTIATDDERRALAQNYTDHSSQDGTMTPRPAADLSKLTKETLLNMKRELDA